MTEKLKKEACLLLLKEKAAELSASGENRLPKRSDFTPDEVCAIKAFWGPFPRALEAAGLKPPRDTDRLAKNREKRLRAKLKRKNETNNGQQ